MITHVSANAARKPATPADRTAAISTSLLGPGTVPGVDEAAVDSSIIGNFVSTSGELVVVVGLDGILLAEVTASGTPVVRSSGSSRAEGTA